MDYCLKNKEPMQKTLFSSNGSGDGNRKQLIPNIILLPNYSFSKDMNSPTAIICSDLGKQFMELLCFSKRPGKRKQNHWKQCSAPSEKSRPNPL